MRRIAAVALGLLLLAASAGAAPVRAQIGTFDDVWVAHRGVAYGAGGSSCSHPHFVADGVDDQQELLYALQDTNAGGVVHVCPGTYHLSEPIDLHMTHDVTLDGAGMKRTILDGGARYRRGVRLSSTSDILWQEGVGILTISNLTAQNGGGGYGAFYLSDLVNFDHVRFYRNKSVYEGGAIWGCDLAITHSEFIDNQGGDGGAISGCDVDISDSIAQGNIAWGTGGAILGDTVTVANSTFIANKASYSGGAIHADSVVVNNSRFTGNVSRGMDACAGGGGAIYAWDEISIRDSSFDRNRADAESCDSMDLDWATNSAGLGGAVLLAPKSPGPSSATILDTTFTRNSAAFAGGALASLGQLNLARLTFTANTSGSWGGALYYLSLIHI
jgi:predicted outer membrane repeat protein